MSQKTPSDFNIYPWSSVFENSECETVALNTMKILKRTGNTFRLLTYEEYKEERLKDGHFSEREHSYFEKVVPYCMSADQAMQFSKEWANA